VGAVNRHRHHRHAGGEGQLDEARSPAEIDLVALTPRAEHFVVAAGEDDDREAALERLCGQNRVGAQQPQLAEQPPEDREREQQIVPQHVQRRLRPAVIDPALD